MKLRILLVVVTLFIITVTGYSGVVFNKVSADAISMDKVKLTWTVSSESNIIGYNVYRSFDNVNYNFISFIRVTAGAGEKTYTYEDNTVFKTEGRTYYYKINYVNNDPSNTISETGHFVQVTPQISSTRHTWGSIKAMFR